MASKMNGNGVWIAVIGLFGALGAAAIQGALGIKGAEISARGPNPKNEPASFTATVPPPQESNVLDVKKTVASQVFNVQSYNQAGGVTAGTVNLQVTPPTIESLIVLVKADCELKHLDFPKQPDWESTMIVGVPVAHIEGASSRLNLSPNLHHSFKMLNDDAISMTTKFSLGESELLGQPISALDPYRLVVAPIAFVGSSIQLGRCTKVELSVLVNGKVVQKVTDSLPKGDAGIDSTLSVRVAVPSWHPQ